MMDGETLIPTGGLRFKERAEGGRTLRILQQRFVRPDRGTVWLDVPCVPDDTPDRVG